MILAHKTSRLHFCALNQSEKKNTSKTLSLKDESNNVTINLIKTVDGEDTDDIKIVSSKQHQIIFSNTVYDSTF